MKACPIGSKSCRIERTVERRFPTTKRRAYLRIEVGVNHWEGSAISQAVASVNSTSLSLPFALAAARVASENRGRDIVILDLRELTPIFDYFVIITGSSRRQLHAISDEIDSVLDRQLHHGRIGSEGYDASRWILLDYGDVVIHMFDDEARDYYALEQLWSAAKRVPFEPAAPQPMRP